MLLLLLSLLSRPLLWLLCMLPCLLPLLPVSIRGRLKRCLANTRNSPAASPPPQQYVLTASWLRKANACEDPACRRCVRALSRPSYWHSPAKIRRCSSGGHLCVPDPTPARYQARLFLLAAGGLPLRNELAAWERKAVLTRMPNGLANRSRPGKAARRYSRPSLRPACASRPRPRPPCSHYGGLGTPAGASSYDYMRKGIQFILQERLSIIEAYQKDPEIGRSSHLFRHQEP